MKLTLTSQDYGIGSMLGSIETAIQEKIKESINIELEAYKKDIMSIKPIKIESCTFQTEVKGLKHHRLEQLLKLASAKQNVMLVGMAGTGKTKGASQVAEALNLPFYCLSVGSQTSKSDLLGFMNANGEYVRTAFRDAYENGGVFVMDEIDAGNSNVLIVLNSALANDVCAFPDKMVERHKDFRFIATANTYGNGADRAYVGRNQLDSATLDRFVVLDWEIDESLEKMLVKEYKYADIWTAAVRDFRNEVRNQGIRAIISPRATVKGCIELELGFTPKEVVDSVIVPQMPQDRRDFARDYMASAIAEASKEAKLKSKEAKAQKLFE